MLRYVIRRLLWTIPMLLITSIIVFVAIKATTNPAALRGPGISSEDALRYREQLGLDKSGTEQYVIWLKNIVRGDLGISLETRQEVWPDLRSAMWNTVRLGLFAWLITITLGVTIGVISAVRQYSWFDNTSTGLSFVGLSVPPFFFGLVLQLVLVLKFQDWFGGTPFYTSQMNSPGESCGLCADRLRHMVLPALTIAVQGVAIYSRLMRASMLDVLSSDYMRTARAKGISERRVIVRHAVRNALIPVTTFAALDIGAIIGGLIITESVFQWPGMGMYFTSSFGDGDYARVLPWMMIVVVSVVVFNLIADILYGVLDPRIRVE